MCPEQQASFDIRDGNPAFPIDHQLIGDIMENNEARKSPKDNRVWDEGYIDFDCDMSQDLDDTGLMLKEVENEVLKQKGLFIQLSVMVDPSDNKESTPIRPILQQGVAKPRTGGGGKTSRRVRKKGDDYSDDNRSNKKSSAHDERSVVSNNSTQAMIWNNLEDDALLETLTSIQYN